MRTPASASRKGRGWRGRILVFGLLAALVLPAPIAHAEPVVLAVAAEDGGATPPAEDVEQLPGPEPNPTTTFAPAEYTRPWTWWMGVVLTVVTLIAIGGAGLGYAVMVRRRDEE